MATEQHIPDSTAHGIRRVLVVGAGTMGRGIAQVVAEHGFDTDIHDVDAAGLERGIAMVRDQWARGVAKGRITEEQAAAFAARLAPAPDLSAAAGIDLAIEAVFEHLETKLALFAELSRRCRPTAILASNTSSISVTRLAAAAAHPERVVGLHFFNPVPLLPLVEVVRALQSSGSTVDRATAFARAIGKEPVLVNDSPGFVVNRVLLPMINEAVFCLADGVATADAIDATMKLGANHPMGPLALADLIGLDVCLDILDTLHRDFGDDKFRAAPLLRRLVAAGRLGRKSGHGFHAYA